MREDPRIHKAVKLKEFPNFVARPTAVWNTRAPLFQFVRLHKRENETYFTLLLATNKLLSECRNASPSLSARKVLGVDLGGRTSGRAWASYKISIRKNDESPLAADVKDVEKSLERALPAATEYAIISYCGLFEAFLQCWTLNYLLAKLEKGKAWEPAERRLAIAFHPWFYSGILPGLPAICKALPVVEKELRKLPHIFVDPRTGEEVRAAMSPNLNAYTTIDFWRKWRNLLVHSSGVANSVFCGDYEVFWGEFREVYPHIPDFQERRILSMRDDTFRALTTVHYSAARRLKEMLVELSGGKRGHVLAPCEQTLTKVPAHMLPESPPPMVMDEDDPTSHRWTHDGNFRNDLRLILRQRGLWKDPDGVTTSRSAA